MTATQLPPGPADPGAPPLPGDEAAPTPRPDGRVQRMLTKYRDAFSVARSTLFWACLMRQKRTLKWQIALLLISSVALFQVTNLTRGMVDNAIVNQTAPLWPYVTHLLFWAVWASFFGFFNMQLSERLGYQIEFDLRVWLYTHIQSAELRNLDRIATGQLVTRSITDLQLVEQLLRIFPALIGASPLLIAIAVLVIILSPVMGILAIVSLPINIFVVRKISRRLRALSWAELNERAEVTHAIDEPVRGIRVVKAFGREQEETQKVEAVTSRAYVYSMTRVRLLARFDAILRAVPIFMAAVLLAVGAWQVSIGALSLGTFLLAFQLGAGLSSTAGIFGELTNAWQYLRGAQDRLAEMLALGSRPVTDGRMVPASQTGLELDHVEVAYGDRRFLHGLTLTASPGELIVVHGAPGSGKSTLAGISSGLVLPDSGEARLDGLALDELDPSELRRAIRVVSEEPLLLAATFRDNLLLGAWGEIDDVELERALRTAGADEVIDEMDGGLDGTIGDRGLTVSGGQRQRISLARALVARPRVLVLDDALSAVNPSLEIEIMARVRQFLPETSILYITRRAGLLDLADRSYDLVDPTRVSEPTAAAAPALATASMLLDEDEDITVARADVLTVGTSGVMDVDEVGLATELSAAQTSSTTGSADDDMVHRSDTSGLAQIDAQLANMVDALELTKDRASVDDDDVYRDEFGTVWSIIRPFKKYLFGALALVVLLAMCQIAPDLVFGQVSDLVGNADNTNLALAELAALGLAFVGILTGFVARYFRIEAQKLAQSIILVLRRRVFKRLTRLGVNYYDRELPGDVATRIVADLDNLLRFVQSTGFFLISSLSITIVGITAILLIAPSTWVIVAIFVGLILLVAWIQLPFAMQGFSWAREELQIVTRKFQEDFTARHEIRNLGAHAIQTQKYVEACWERRRARWWATTVGNVQASFITLLATSMSAFLLWKTGQGVLAQQLSVGTALAVQLLANTATLPLRSLGGFYNQALDVRVSLRRLKEPFAEPILPVESPTAVECPGVQGAVRFEDVEFAYPATARTVLRKASFSMEPHKVTALVGYTGAGKSSIAKLLMRTYDPDAGRITIDGVDIRDFGIASYRGRLGIVPQDPFVFQGTVASNVRYGNPDATDAEVEAALRSVGAYELLSVLESGFEHRVEEEGHNLTAAQRQLIALARAWLTQPDLLVLDESTSLLDHGVEDQVIAAVHELGCTTLMITHRENVATLADNIVVLDAGRVVDEGPEEIVARPGGAYERLWRVVEDSGTGSLLQADLDTNLSD